MPNLIETLAAELERPRHLSTQVINHIGGTYGVDNDYIGPFLVVELPKLEDYEHDLILSPVFTPKLADQPRYAELLGRESIPRDQWPALIRQLVARPIRAQLITSDNRTHSVTLREVTLERYVHRLRLDATIPESLFNQIAPLGQDRPMLTAIARRAVWENEARRNILSRYLENSIAQKVYRISDAVDLLNLVESYRPADVADLLGKIPHLHQLLEQEINAAFDPKPFFSGTVQAMHGGSQDRRQQDEAKLSAKKNELAFLERLQKILEG